MQEQNAQLATEVRNLQTSLNQAQSSLEVLKNQPNVAPKLAELSQQYQALERTHQQTQQQLAETASEKESLHTALQLLGAQNAQQAVQVSSLQQALSQATNKPDLQPKLALVKQGYNELQQTHEQVKRQAENQQIQLNAIHAEKAQLKDSVVTLESENHFLAKHIRQLEAALKSTESEAKLAQSKTIDLQPKLAKLNNDYLSLQRSHQDTQERFEQLKEQSAQQSVQIANLQSALLATQSSLTDAKNQPDLQPKLAQLNSRSSATASSIPNHSATVGQPSA